jgi:hypothetical protein
MLDDLLAFREFGTETRLERRAVPGFSEPLSFVWNEFWTARQRQAHSLHEISYRACFKPQLPRFFIERLTAPGETVYDPFMGRGTTLLEAALMGRLPAGCDVNPLARVLLEPRLDPPPLEEIADRLAAIDLTPAGELPADLLVFFHPETLAAICALRAYLADRVARSQEDAVDRWIRMVAVNRLTGHSVGFFSVYTLPPNQATSVTAQRRINARRNQTPPLRDVKRIILKKSAALLKDCNGETRARLRAMRGRARILTGRCDATFALADASVNLVVTSPPFLNVVDYRGDNWLRCWFCGIDPEGVNVTTPRRVDDWAEEMARVFRELARVLVMGGHVAFEVGEVNGGTVCLEDVVLPCGVAAGLEPVLVLIQDQEFTKTSHCWGVENRSKGTNTNRVVVFKR